MKILIVGRMKWFVFGIVGCLLALGVLWTVSDSLEERHEITRMLSYWPGPDESQSQAQREPVTDGEVIERGPAVNRVALMINVDWGVEYIPPLLQLLAQNEGRVTFFVTGRFAKENPEMVRQIHSAGHEIGNHGFSHPHPTKISDVANRDEIAKTDQVLMDIIGTHPVWFAPPYGEHDSRVVRIARELGYRTVLWTVDTADWRQPTPQQWMRRVTQGIGPGALVLMHPTKVTLDTLPELLGYCQKQKWQVVTLTELFRQP